jgi:type III secretory pathway component EscV
MKNSISIFLLLCAVMCLNLSLNAQDARREKSLPQEWKREKSLPQEWKNDGQKPNKKEANVPVEVEVSNKKLKQTRSNVLETNLTHFRNAASYRKGLLIGSKSYQQNTDYKNQKLVVLFTTTTVWATPLTKNEMKVENEKFNQVLTKYKLTLEKYYGADAQQDGLVIKFTSSTNAEEAAIELSKIDGVNFVYLKVKK